MIERPRKMLSGSNGAGNRDVERLNAYAFIFENGYIGKTQKTARKKSSIGAPASFIS